MLKPTDAKDGYLIRGDEDYARAVNHEHDYYNPPTTLNYKGVKYILPCGNSDDIRVFTGGESCVYILGGNKMLTYISLTVINTESKEITGDVYLNEQPISDPDCIAYNIFDKDSQQQVEILLEYMPY